MMDLDLVQTLAFSGLVLFLGYALRRTVPPFSRYNLPAPVLGGLAVALAMLAARSLGHELIRFDPTLREPLMIAFFTTIGFGASGRLLRLGGPQVATFLILSTLAAICQNLVGAAAAYLMKLPPLLGVLCGSVTLTGGPATGLAFADQFEQAGVTGAEAIAVAAAMMGIVSGGILGAPVGTFLIERLRRAPTDRPTATRPARGESGSHDQQDVTADPPGRDDGEAFGLLKNVTILLVAMWIGSWVGAGLTALHIRMPAYIGAMFVAAAIRNLDDVTGWFGLSQRVLDDLGNVALAFFLAMAMISLELWKLSAVAVPLFVLVSIQLVLIFLLSVALTFPWMGRDYDAAVMSSGFIGFMMGTTANAMANMDALVQRYGPAPRAFLVVPMVGAFFIDFINAILIQASLNALA